MARKRKKAKKRKRKAKAKAEAKQTAPAVTSFVFVEVRLADPALLASGAVEVAALRPPAENTPDGPGEVERFHEYVKPTDRASKGALTKAELERAVAPEDAATALAAFTGDSIVATRSAPGLRASFPGAVDEEKLLDLAEFARAVRPEMAGFGAADLARLVGEIATAETGEKEGASNPSGPDSLAREAEITRRVWEVLREELAELPRAVLAQATWLVPPACDALGTMVFRAEAAAHGDGKAGEKALKELFAERGEELRSARQPRPLGEPQSLDEAATEKLLEPGGSASRALAGYEDRPQQRRMASAVAQAFSAGRHLLVEGGTGVGKSLAYLFPAVLWARRCNRPVVVATHTKNLQSQLFEKDLPLVARALACETEGKGEFRTALIKGRRNYLCLRKLFYLLRASTWELDPAERAGMLPVLTWAVRTHTGDLGENNALQQFGPWSLFDKLTTMGDECMGKRCSAFGQCFLQAARARSLRADVVVANHALVFAELGLETPVLPDYEEVVFDEAQHVEDVATEHLAVRASRSGVMRILVRLFRTRRGGAGTGLL
ncbi:MAG: DEAD/DEAH box helicase, partial [Planctomycetota bacterium]